MSQAQVVTAEERFAELFRDHRDAVERYIRRRTPRDVVGDLTADVFAVVWRRVDDVPAQALPWIYGIARRVIANYVRSAGRAEQLHVKLIAQARSNPGGRGEFGDPSEALVAATALAEALNALSDTDREVLALAAWEGLSATQAAVAAGCTRAAYVMRLSRARTRLRRSLQSKVGWENPNNEP